MKDKFKLSRSFSEGTFQPGTVDMENRTVEIVFTTGAEGLRYDYYNNEYWIEELEVSDRALSLERLNQGAPILDSHDQYGSVRNQLGVVLEARIEDKKGIAKIKYSERHLDILKDVRDGVLRSFSVGYRINELKQVEKKTLDKHKRFRAVKWEPFEISNVSIPFDIGAQARNFQREGKEEDFYNVDVTFLQKRNSSMTEEEKRKLEEEKKRKLEADETKRKLDSEEATKRAVEAERKRSAGILDHCRKLNLSSEFANKLVVDGTDLNAAREFIIDEVAKRGSDSVDSNAGTSSVKIMMDERQVRVDGLGEAILNRVDPNKFKISDKSRRYHNISLLEACRAISGVEGYNKNEIAKRAMSTSDFANLLLDASNKRLRASYDETPSNYEGIIRVVNAPDFKNLNVVQISEAAPFEAINEGEEVTFKEITDGKETYALASYAVGHKITRKAIINDDLSAFNRVPNAMALRARSLEADLVFAQLQGIGVTMGDSVAMYNAAHNNLGTGGAISETTLNEMFVAMATHDGVRGSDVKVTFPPVYLYVPYALYMAAKKNMAAILSAETDNVNVWSGQFEVIPEARLDAQSTVAWYGASAINRVPDMIELAVLDGVRRPQIEVYQPNSVNEGIRMEGIYDLAARTIEYRAFFKNAGE